MSDNQNILEVVAAEIERTFKYTVTFSTSSSGKNTAKLDFTNLPEVAKAVLSAIRDMRTDEAAYNEAEATFNLHLQSSPYMGLRAAIRAYITTAFKTGE